MDYGVGHGASGLAGRNRVLGWSRDARRGQNGGRRENWRGSWLRLAAWAVVIVIVTVTVIPAGGSKAERRGNTALSACNFCPVDKLCCCVVQCSAVQRETAKDRLAAPWD